jgi:hypothetical protein
MTRYILIKIKLYIALFSLILLGYLGLPMKVMAATRFYLPSTGTPPISPAADGSWEQTSDLIRLSLVTTKIGSTQLIQSGASNSTTGSFDVLLAQYISDPLGAQTIDGTVKGVTKARETNGAADLRTQMIIKVVSGDGLTVRGTLLSHDEGTLTSEWSTSSTLNSRLAPVALRSNTLTPVVAQAGDRVVVEIGYRRHTTIDPTSYTGRLYFEDSGTDLPESDSDTTVGDPWIEFSDDLLPTHTVVQGDWRFYADATPDSGMSALDDENTAPTLSGAQMQNAKIRLRAQLIETGAVAGSGNITLQYGGDGTNWNTITGPSGGSGNEPNYWFRFIDGAATAGQALGTQLLSDTTSSGVYHEDTGVSESVGASAVHEIDLALMVRWPAPDETVRFRILYNGTPVDLGSGKTEIQLITSPAAERPYTITRLDPDGSQEAGRELRFSFWNRLYYDGTRWWFFTVQYNTPLVLRAYSWDGVGNAWVERTSHTFDTNGQQGRNSMTFKKVNGVPTVYVNWGGSTAGRRIAKGEISGTTITWSDQTLVQTTLSQTHHIAVDDDNYLWVGGIRATDTIYARRSTNVNDITAWQAEKTLTDTGVASPDEFAIIGLSSDKAIAVWYNGTDQVLKWATVSDSGGFGSVNTLATANNQDWGWIRYGGYIYLVHTGVNGDGGNWHMKVFNENTGLWETAPDPGVGGQTSTRDGIALTRHGNDIYAVGTFEGAYATDRILKYIKYTVGPGASGSWGSLTTMTQANRGNGDRVTTAPESDGTRIMYGFEFSDDDLIGNAHTAEYHYLDVYAPTSTTTSTSSNSSSSSGGTSVNFCSADSPPSSVPSLFQIDTNLNTATLYFVPSGNPVAFYTIAYGTARNPEEFAVRIDQGYYPGVLAYTVRALAPNTTYYFKIRGGYGCANTTWSQTIKATTGSRVRSFYPTLVANTRAAASNLGGSIARKAAAPKTTVIPRTPTATSETPSETREAAPVSINLTKPGPEVQTAPPMIIQAITNCLESIGNFFKKLW